MVRDGAAIGSTGASFRIRLSDILELAFDSTIARRRCCVCASVSTVLNPAVEPEVQISRM